MNASVALDWNWFHSRGIGLPEAQDRVAFLREHGFKARALAVLALPTDTAEELGEVTKGQPGGC